MGRQVVEEQEIKQQTLRDTQVKTENQLVGPYGQEFFVSDSDLTANQARLYGPQNSASRIRNETTPKFRLRHVRSMFLLQQAGNLRNMHLGSVVKHTPRAFG